MINISTPPKCTRNILAHILKNINCSNPQLVSNFYSKVLFSKNIYNKKHIFIFDDKYRIVNFNF